MPRAAIIAYVGLLGCKAAVSAPPADDEPTRAAPTRATPPTERDVIDALLRNADLKPTHASCRNLTGIEGDDTLGDYVAHLLAQLAAAHAEGTAATLTAACDQNASSQVFRCRFVVHVKAQDPWQYGVHFDLQADGNVLGIQCPGAA